MAQSKAKSQQKIQKKARLISKATAQSKAHSKSSSLATWQNVISELKQTQFADLDQAILAVADRVIAKLGKSLANDTVERDFLVTLLKTDPSVSNKLRELLRIKRA